MDTTSFILTGLIVISLTLYYVFTFAKPIEIIQKISAAVFFPLLGALYLYFLMDVTPDSYHIIKISILAYFFISLSFILGIFISNAKLLIISRLSFLLSIISWGFLFKSVFLIHWIPNWVNIIVAISYAVVIFLFFIIFIRKASIKFYCYGIISLIFAGFINYCSILNLCFSPAIFTVISFLGTTALIGYIIFNLLNNSVIDLKLKKLISFMILLASYFMISFSNLMILY